MTQQPLVSIGVPTYNRAPLLEQTLQSILAQEYPALEVVISDNGSTDGTEALCRAVAAGDPRVRYVRQPRNLGLHGNHNFLIEHTSGEYLCFFHDDDVYGPKLIAEAVAFLRDRPDVGLVGSDWDLIDDDGALLGTRAHPAPAVTPGLGYIERTTRTGRSSLGCTGTIARRVALGDVRFDEDGALGFGDFIVWFQVAERWAVGHIARPLWSYRLHRRSASRRTIESIAGDYDRTLSGYFDGHLRRWPAHAALVGHWRRHTRRYLFWALAYELALHYRKTSPSLTPLREPTIFEMAAYRLTDEELARVVRRLHDYRTGALQHVTFFVIRRLLQLHLTRPLAWIARYPSSVRAVLGLR